MSLLLLVLCIDAFCCFLVIYNYKKSNYYKITKRPYLKMHCDAGFYGEYLTYKELRSYEKNGARFLFNCYLPKEDGNTTEIDLLLICGSGIYVFESKNYSGWIFGSESGKNWTQTLPQGQGKKAHKEYFLNPILQNRHHIRCLNRILEKEVPIHSVIVFSDRCTFKKMVIESSCVFVVKRSDVGETVNKLDGSYKNALLAEEIEHIYKLLYPYTQVSDRIKTEHIAAIRNKAETRNAKPVIIQNPLKNTTAEAKADTVSGQQKNTKIPYIMADNKDEPAGQRRKEPLICPRCSGNLILRTAGRGVNKGKCFYGCCNYPKCRYTRNLEK